MGKRGKFFAGLMATVIVAGTLAGCGSSDKAASKGGDQKTITVWTRLTDPEIEEVNKLAEQWGKDKGCKVKVVKDDGDFQAFLQAANSSKGPDMVFGMPHDNLGTFQTAGLLAEVPKDFANKDDYANKTVWDAVSYDGKAYAVPIAMETYALYYNKSKVKEAPKTMDDLITQAKAYDKTGFQFDINNFYYAGAFVQAYGGYVFGGKEGSLDPNDIGLDNAGAIKGFTFLQDLVQKDKFMPADMTGDIAKASFTSQQSIFYLSGPWDIAPSKEAGVDFGIAPIPQINGKGVPSFLGVQAAFVSAKSKNQDETWDLMKYLVKNSGQVLLDKGNRIPVLKSELENDNIKNNEYLQGFIEQTKYAVPMPNIKQMQAVWGPMGNLSRLYQGENPSTVAKEIVEGIKQGIATQQ